MQQRASAPTVSAGKVLLHGYLAAWRGWPGLCLGIAGLVPFLLMFGYSALSGRSIVLCRYLTYLEVAWLASLAYFAFWLPPSARWAIIAAVAEAWLWVSYPTAWPIIGPDANPGMRQAVEDLLRRRAPDEPVVAQRPITLIKALYYLRGRPPVRLCVEIPSRVLQPQGPWLEDDELTTPAEVLSLKAGSVWVLSTSWYDESPEVAFPLPGNWRLEEAFHYPQDYPGEGPVVVYHCRVQD